MTESIRRRLKRLIALMLLVPLAACASEQKPTLETIRDGMEATRAAVRQIVIDHERRTELLAHIDELELLLTRQELELREGSRILRELNANPATPRATFEREIEKLSSNRQERRSQAIDIHFAMADLTTPTEWKRIIDREMEALGAMIDMEEN